MYESLIKESDRQDAVAWLLLGPRPCYRVPLVTDLAKQIQHFELSVLVDSDAAHTCYAAMKMNDVERHAHDPDWTLTVYSSVRSALMAAGIADGKTVEPMYLFVFRGWKHKFIDGKRVIHDVAPFNKSLFMKYESSKAQ